LTALHPSVKAPSKDDRCDIMAVGEVTDDRGGEGLEKGEEEAEGSAE
jgi:hypothetical protein